MMIELFHHPSHDFIGKRKWAYRVSGVAILVSLASADRRPPADLQRGAHDGEVARAREKR